VTRFRALLIAAASTLVALTVGGLVAAPAGAGLTSPPLVSASTWSNANAANPSPLDNGLNAVTCATSSFCVAVGFEASGGGGGALTEQWNGASWAVVPNPDSAVSEAYLLSVSCAGPDFCVAVGTGQGTSGALVLMWNGLSWTAATGIAVPPGSEAPIMYSVSCVSATVCETLGSYNPGSTSGTVFAYQWNGTSWTSVTAATPSVSGAPPIIAPSSMDCVSATWCIAVGDTNVNSNEAAPFSEEWNGAAWSLVTTPAGTGGVGSRLNAVSCDGSSFCQAVGRINSSGGSTDQNLIETWNGTAWSIDPGVPNQSGVPNGLSGVDCFSATSCSAVGTIGSGGTLALTWNGTSWSIVANVPQGGPSGSPKPTTLNAVTCVTDWACLAVGTYTSGTNFPFAMSAPIARSGYRFVASDGGVFSYGAGAPFLGSTGGMPLNAPVVGLGAMPAGDGYYLAASDGGVFNYGSAQFYGSAGSIHLNKPVVGMAVTPDGGGYWLVASDGGIFNYGDAQFYGSRGGQPLNKPIVGMAATPDGKGYYLVASDGGIFNYGDAQFDGSTGGTPLTKPIVGMSVPTSGGYYLVASDGGIFSFPTGTGPTFYGSTGSIALNKPIVGMTTVQGGYYLSGSDGGVFTFPPGGPPFYGSTGGTPLNKPIVGIAS
jgi:hypothetical protein